MDWRRIPIQLFQKQYEYLKKRAFEQQKRNPKVSMSSIIRDLIDKEMKLKGKEDK